MRRWSLSKKVTIGLILIGLLVSAGCGTVLTDMREDLRANKPQVALKTGLEWLRDNPDRSRKLKTRTALLRLIAESRLAIARKADNEFAYQKFQRMYRYDSSVRDLVRKARQFEGAAVYRDRVVAANTVAMYRWFRGRYGDTSASRLALEAELGLLFRKTAAVDTEFVWKGFIAQYRSDPGASHFIKKARVKQFSAAMREAISFKVASALRNLRKRYRSWPEAAAHLQKLRALELKLAFDEAVARKTSSALKELRAFYRRWPEMRPLLGRVRTLEVALALEEAKKLGTVDAYRSFREEYGTWNEAKPYIAQVRRLEVKIAYDLAVHAEGIAALQAFRTAYEDWAEAVELRKRAYDLEAARVLKAAIASLEPIAALRRFKKTYVEKRFQLAADKQIARIVLAPLIDGMKHGKRLSYAVAQRLADWRTEVPQVAVEAESIKKALWAHAKKTQGATWYYAYYRLFPGDKRHKQAFESSAELAWKAADQLGTIRGWRHFLDYYVESSRALSAERRLLSLERLARGNSQGLTARVTRRATLPDGTIELYVDVRGCDRERVSGLTGDLFEVYEGGHAQEITGFLGMEDDRSLDLMFALDMSGSMSVEREAVRDAVNDFAFQLSLRNRQLDMGLVSFSEVILDSVKPGSIRQFSKAMRGLSKSMGGGNGEDGVVALLTSARHMRKNRQERVIILMSDEELQMNLKGRQWAGKLAKTKNPCKRQDKVLACLKRCQKKKRGRKKCQLACASKLSAWVKKSLKRCVKRFGVRRCHKGLTGWNSVLSSLSQCSKGRLAFGNPYFDALIKELEKNKIRPFFLVPQAYQGSSYSGYVALAKRLQGRVIHVPIDSRSKAPYQAALLEVADQLSRQYVIRYRRPKGAPARPSRVLVRPLKRWSGVSSLPQKSFSALVRLSGTSKCPKFLAVGALGKVYLSQNCGQGWSALPPTSPPGRVLKVVSNTGSPKQVAILFDDGRVLAYESGKSLVPVIGGEAIRQIAFDSDGRLHAIKYDATTGTTQILRQMTKTGGLKPITGPRFQDGTKGHVPVFLSLPSEDQSLCLLTHPRQMVCLDAKGQTWIKSSVKGLPDGVNHSTTNVVRLPMDRDIRLLKTPNGAIYRTIDGGSRWRKVMAPTKGKRSLLVLAGEERVICVASKHAVRCSEDTGRSWDKIGTNFFTQGFGTLAYVDGQLYLAQGGDLRRLRRVSNRELPASSVHFATNSSRLRRGSRAFFRQIARKMLDDPSLLLRLEGHADKRGSRGHNQVLAGRRARSVAKAVRSFGVPKSRIQVLSFGERHPIRKGNTTRAFKLNRRVEFVLMRASEPKSWFANDCKRN